jgi:multiple sugar transport system substrate-binding protein
MDRSEQPSPFTRRRFLTIFGLSAVGVLATACGSSATPTTGTGSTGTGASTAPASSVPASTAPAASAAGSSTAPSAAGGAVVTVTWFAGRDPSGFTAKQIEKFNAQNTGVKIDYQEQGSTTTDLKDKFTTVASAKDSSADIVSADVPFVPEFAAAGWTADLDASFSAEERAQFFPGTIAGVTYDKKIYAMPWYNNGPGLFYRKDIFQAAGVQPPKSYSEMVATAKKLQTNDMAGYLTLASQSEQGVISWLEMVWGLGGDMMDEQLNVVLDKGTQGAEAFQLLLDMVYKDKVLPEFSVQGKATTDTAFPFRDGKGSMIRAWYTAIAQFNDPAGQIVGKWDVVPLPSKDGVKPGPGCLGTWNLAVSKFSKKQPQAIAAVKWLTAADQQRQRVLDIGSFPARSAVFDDADVKAKYPFVDSLKQSLQELKPRPVTPYYSEMSSNVLQPNVGAVMVRQKTPEQAIKDISEGLRKIATK